MNTPPRLAAARAALALALAAGAASAQTLGPLPPPEAPARLLTWNDCVAAAALQNPALVSAEYAAKAGRANYYGSFNAFMPAITLSNSLSEGSASQAKPSYSAQGAASVNLFDVGRIANVRSASASYSQADAARRQASASLRASLLGAFAHAYFAEKTVAMSGRVVEIQKRNAELVSLRYDSGKEYKGNMMNAKAQALQARAGYAQALRALRTARRGLDQQLGLDDFSDVAVTGTLVAQAPPDFPAQMQSFVDLRPDVAVQEAAVRNARAAVLSSQSPLFPALTASYTRSRLGSAEFPSAAYGWTAGATLSYPLFGAGPTAAYFGVKSAKASLEKARQDLRAIRDSARMDLETAWANYATAVDQATVQTALLESLRQRNDEGAVRYASGLLTFDNWQVIVTQWVGAEQSAIQAEESAVTAQAQWEKALGKALGE